MKCKELKKSQVELTISVPDKKMEEYKKRVIKKFSEISIDIQPFLMQERFMRVNIVN